MLKEHDTDFDQSWTRAILNAAYDAFIAINSEGRIIDWNPQAERTFGWSKAEVLNRPLHETIIPQRHREAHQRGMAHYLATGNGPVLNRRIEIDARNREGHEIPVELIIYPVHQGEKLVFGAFLHDITQRRQAERMRFLQLAVTEILTEAANFEQAMPKVLQKVCEQLKWSSAEFWRIDPNLKVLKCVNFWSLPLKELANFERKTREMTLEMGRGLPGEVWQKDAAIFKEDIRKENNFLRTAEAIEGGICAAVGIPVRVENKLVGIMAFYVPEVQEADKNLLELMDDIGRRISHFIMRRRAEKKLTEMNQELEKRVEARTHELAQTNEQLSSAHRLKDEFLATMSHELRTPLNVMQGHSELLLEEDLSAPVRSSVETIYRNAQMQGHLISDLLDVSKIISGKMELANEAVNLVEVIKSALETVKIAAASKDIQIVLDLDSHIGPVSGDANRLQQVLWNLLTNAVKFSPRSSKIFIELRNVNSRAQILVKDQGKGIEPEFLPYVFERFRQEDASTTRRYGGLGLGLAIARHISEAHGGTIEVSSKGKDQGASFLVTLPFLGVRHEPGASELAPANATALRAKTSLEGIKILVVEDQEDTRLMLGRMLERAGAIVVLANSSQQALSLLGQQTPDVIVSDIGLPDESGYTLMEKIRAMTGPSSKIPALALTAFAHSSDREKALASGFNLHMSKPVGSAELLKSISELLK